MNGEFLQMIADKEENLIIFANGSMLEINLILKQDI